MSSLDPNMVTFLVDHPKARAIVYRMMRNAATTLDDPKMVAWYAPVDSLPKREQDYAFIRLINQANT